MDVEKRLEPAMTAMTAWGQRDTATLAHIAQQYDLKTYEDIAIWIVKEIVATYHEAVEEHWQEVDNAPRLVAFETRNARRRGKSHLS